MMVSSISKDKMVAMNNPEKPHLFKMRRFHGVPCRIDTRRTPFQTNSDPNQDQEALTRNEGLAESQVAAPEA